MSSLLRSFTLTSSILVLSACGVGQAPTTAVGTCFIGGPIYTAIDAAPKLAGVRVSASRIIAVTSGPVTKDWCANDRIINLDGAALYPGFTDAHAHLLGIGLREMTLNLEGTTSIEELKSRLAEAVADTPKGETVYGRGWIETHWPEKRFPNRTDLDSVSPDNPVILERADGHAVVVNSAAISASGITRDTQAPFGGDILKDENGEPTGMLIDKADQLVADLMPKITEARKIRAYEQGARLYASRGWTNIHAMSVNPDNIPIMENVAKAGNLPIRVYNSIDPGNGFKSELFDRSSQALIRTRAIKLYTDGALGSRGAALLAPYDDDPGNDGLLLITLDEIRPILERALREGVQVNTHAIGDRANRLLLDWYEGAFESVPESERAVPEPRWRVEHAQIVAPDDIPRYAELGVIPSMQPSHAISDLHFAVDRIGTDRLVGGYAWRSLIDSGSIIAGGSDAPVEVGDPRIEFFAAVARKDLAGFSNESWYPSEKVTRQEALKMFTIWSAHAAFQENELGTIEPGKEADFTVFDKDIMTIPEDEIMNAKVIMTVVGGRIVYRAD